MATFSNFFTATIYGSTPTFDGKNGGWQIGALFQSASYRAFSKSGINLYTISPAIVVTNQGVSVTLNSIIEVLPSGVVQYPQKLLTDSTFANLYTQGA